MTEAHWEHFPHQADIGVRGFGASLAQAFEQAALAMTAVITDPATITEQDSVHIECEAPDPELLLVDWLNGLIYEMAVSKMLFSRFHVEIQDHRLKGEAWGEKIDLSRHDAAVEIKGATYTALQVGPMDDGGWLAQCVVDV